jgi:hypothetical protein
MLECLTVIFVIERTKYNQSEGMFILFTIDSRDMKYEEI